MILRSMRVPVRLVAVVVGTALLAACGAASQADAPTSTDALRLRVSTDPDPLRSGQPGAFVLEVTNEADRDLAMSFDTTQRGDVALETNGVEVYRWAARRVFAHDETQVVVGAGDTVSYRLEELRLPVGPGDYELLATMDGRPKLQVIREPLTVEGSGAAGSTTAEPSEPTASGPSAPASSASGAPSVGPSGGPTASASPGAP